MRVAIAFTILLLTASAAHAQFIDTWNAVGPSGTHFNLELPAPSYTYVSFTNSGGANYRHTFNVYKNGVIMRTETFDVINPANPQQFTRIVDMSTWNLVVGDVIHFFSRVKLLSNLKIQDTDSLYGDCVDLIRHVPSGGGSDRAAFLAAAVDEKRRFETLLA